MLRARRGPFPLCACPSPTLALSSLQTRSSISVRDIRAVERVDEGAFQLPHVMQVVTRCGAGALHTVYLQCKVCAGDTGATGPRRGPRGYQSRLVPSPPPS